jgi:hypothetical protein
LFHRRWAGLWLDGWVLSDYTIPTTGDYYLQAGVVNWSDKLFDSGLALDGVSIGGVPIGPPTPPATTPEPASLAILACGLLGIGAFRRRSARQ